jgi:sarcosine oxidase gamma subunit
LVPDGALAGLNPREIPGFSCGTEPTDIGQEPRNGLQRCSPDSKETAMGLAEYMIISKPDGWTVLHDGTAQNDYGTKEAAFEAAVAAASLAIRQGHEVRVSVPGRDAGNKTALGAKDPQSASQ